MRILLREVRESKHISRRELAARAGVSRSWIEELECGDANPSILMLCKLAHVLEVALSSLGWKEPEYQVQACARVRGSALGVI